MKHIPWLLGAGLAASTLFAAPANATTHSATNIGDCQADLAGTTYTLTANCTTTTTIEIPDGYTLNGNGHTITARNPSIGYFSGSVVTNEEEGHSMHLRNLTIRGDFPTSESSSLSGVSFVDASGSVDNVRVEDIEGRIPSPHGAGINVSAWDRDSHQTVAITRSTVSGFGHHGLEALGRATVNVSDSTIGPGTSTTPPMDGSQQVTVWYLAGAGGTFTRNEVIASGRPGEASLAMAIVHTANLTITGNQFRSIGTSHGITLYQSSNIKIAYNHIARTEPQGSRVGLYGVWADDESRPQTTLICNTFSGWDHNLRNLTQPPCYTLHVTKTASPNPAIAGQPLTYTVTIINKGPDNAHNITVNDRLPHQLTGFTWTCHPHGAHSKCHVPSGTGSISHAPVDIGAHGKVIFLIKGTVPAHATGTLANTVHVDGAADSATVTVPVRPGLPLTGPDLMPEAAGGTALLALGGLLLLPSRRRRQNAS